MQYITVRLYVVHVLKDVAIVGDYSEHLNFINDFCCQSFFEVLRCPLNRGVPKESFHCTTPVLTEIIKKDNQCNTFVGYSGASGL